MAVVRRKEVPNKADVREKPETGPVEQEPAPPRISVLIVSHNNADALRRCLNALENSKSRNEFEILVVDNGSVDECPQMDAEFPGITMLRLPRNFGATKALNIGMRTAVGELIFFLHPEAELTPETVSVLAARLDAEPDVAAVCPVLVDESGQAIPVFHRLPDPAALSAAWRRDGALDAVQVDLNADAAQVEYPGRAALMVRKQFLKGMNYLDERYGEYWADAELCYQIRRAQRKILALAGVRAVYRPGPSLPDYPPPVRAVLSADYASGAAAFAGKHYGFFTGLGLRLGAAFSALGQALMSLARFRDVGYHWSRFFALATGQKVDGSQSAL